MVFSLRQLQEKCREQNHPLYIAFIDITKGFDLMSRNSVFFILGMIACPLKLLNVIQSFHIDMKDAVQFHGALSDAFIIRSGVRRGCVLVPTPFDIYNAGMLKQSFGASTEGVHLRTRSTNTIISAWKTTLTAALVEQKATKAAKAEKKD